MANSEGQSNYLYRNNGYGTFTKITSGIVVTDAGDFTGGSWGDYDNDGDLDLFVTNRNGGNPLYRNDGSGNFSKIIIDNDGGVSMCSAWGDLDNDGDLDLFVANAGLFGENANDLYLNNGNSNYWINVKCIGTFSNTAAIGAKVRVKAQIRGNNVWQVREISGGNDGGVGGQNSLNAEFGLGDASVIDSIKVEWPSGIVQVLTNISPNQFLNITESKSLPAAPQNLQARAGVNQVTLTWDANTEPDFLRYRIYGGTSPSPTAKIDSVDGAANTTKTIKNLTAGTTYFFRITAVDKSFNESRFSNEASVTPNKTMIFENITSSAGINGTGLTNSVSFNDYNNDGDLDLLVGNNDYAGPFRLLRNEGSIFKEVTVNSGLDPTTSYFRGNSFSDFDNDGYLDLIVIPNNERNQN